VVRLAGEFQSIPTVGRERHLRLDRRLEAAYGITVGAPGNEDAVTTVGER